MGDAKNVFNLQTIFYKKIVLVILEQSLKVFMMLNFSQQLLWNVLMKTQFRITLWILHLNFLTFSFLGDILGITFFLWIHQGIFHCTTFCRTKPRTQFHWSAWAFSLHFLLKWQSKFCPRERTLPAMLQLQISVSFLQPFLLQQNHKADRQVCCCLVMCFVLVCKISFHCWEKTLRGTKSNKHT